MVAGYKDFVDNEEVVAKILLDAAETTDRSVGDGTTSTVLLTYALADSLFRSKQSLKDSHSTLDSLLSSALKGVEESSDSLSGELAEDVIRVAGNSDLRIVPLFKPLLSGGKIHQGTILVEDSMTGASYTDMAEGYTTDFGYINRAFSNNQEDQTSTLETPNVVVVDKELNTVKGVVPILEAALKSDNRSLVLFCRSMKEAVASTIYLNTVKNPLQACVVVVPPYKDPGGKVFEDIAATCNAAIIGGSGSEYTIKDLNKPELVGEIFGSIGKSTISEDRTILSGVTKDNPRHRKLIESISAYMDRPNITPKEFELGQHRLTNLSSGVYTIFVGSDTGVSSEELKDRVVDAVGSFTSAREHGVVKDPHKLLSKLVSEHIPECKTLEQIFNDNGFATHGDSFDPASVTSYGSAGVVKQVLRSSVAGAKLLLNIKGAVDVGEDTEDA